MGWIAAATIGAGALSAGGNLGAAALADDGLGKARVGAPGARRDPGLQAVQFFNLLNQGIVDPTSLMQGAPIARLIGQMQADSSRAINTRGKVIDQITDMWNRYQKFIRNNPGVPVPNSVFSIKGNNFVQEEALQSGGFLSIRDLFEQQTGYIEQIGPIIQRAQGLAGSALNSRLSAQERIQAVLGDLPDASASGIQTLSGQIKTSMLRELETNVGRQRQDLLSAANAGNFNPGTALGDIETFRAGATQDADIEATNRALAIIGGQQTLAGNEINTLQGALQNIDATALQAANLNLGAGPATTAFGPVTTNQAAGFVSDAGVSLGNTGLGLANIFAAQGRTPPPATPFAAGNFQPA